MNNPGSVHPVHCLPRRDIALFDTDQQLGRAEWHRATRAEIRFRGHKDDQDQLGAVLVLTRDMAGGPCYRWNADGGAVAVLVEPLASDLSLSEHVPLSAVKTGETARVWD